MKKKTLRILGRTGCLSLAALIALSAPASVYASAAGTKKDETVYVNLDSAGAVRDTIVSDWLHSDDPSQRITDKSDLKNIQNVKTNEKAVQQGDTLSWVLGTDNTGKNIYYQGTTQKQSPLTVTMAYTLNGKDVSAAEIAGKTGKVTVSLTLKNTSARTVSVSGKDVTMYTPMTAVAAAILPSDTFKNVTVNSGKVLTDGNNQFVTFLAMPGLSDSLGLKDSAFPELNSLNLPETLTIEADAVNFHLPSITVAATPKIVDADKLAGSGDVGKVVDNISKLKNLQNDLQNADPQKNISSLMTNPDRTAAAKLLVDDVFDFYGLDTSAANLLPKYVNDNTFTLADRVTSDLTKSDLKYLVDNHVLDKAAGSLAQVNLQSANSLLNDYAALGAIDTSKLQGAGKLLNDSAKYGDSLASVLGDTANLTASMKNSDLSSLNASLKIFTDSDVQSSLNSTLSNLNKLNNLTSTAEKAGIQLKQEDVEALLESYLIQKLPALATQAINAYAVGGNITVGGLTSIIKNLPLTLDSQIKLEKAMANVSPDLATAFAKGDSATVSAQTVEKALSDVPSDQMKAIVEPLAASLSNSINALLESTTALQSSLTGALGSDYADKLKTAMTDASKAAPYLAALQNDYSKDQAGITQTMADAQSLLSSGDLAYLARLSGNLQSMQNDLKANSGNVAAVAQLMQTMQDSHVQNFFSTVPSLKNDLTSAESVAASLQSDLKRSGVSTSRSSMTNTMNTLLKMRSDVNNSRDIMNIFRQATQPGTVSVFREALTTADNLQNDPAVSGLLDKMGSAQDLLARKDAYLKLSDDNQIFTEAADGASTSVKFVYKTAEIKKPAAKPAVQKAAAQNDSGSGIGHWFQSVFAGIRNFFHF